ncbi:hypothetical protein B9479_002089 [Cryptococcus floricola]|uniref:Uncharacterized protein n=1 Tax=Cryptococcus floricola TaxID=2591691 RepID=A0A5D3B326_9TREE|nr:hypothetical protein B9479_002089 [Cryptococcus floricola]
MPVAKKKGAVFGIYADSPARDPHPQPTRSSPRRPSNTARKALASKPVAPTAAASSNSLASATSLKGNFLLDTSSSKPKSTKSSLQIFSDPEPSKPKSASSVTGVTKRRNAPTPLAPTQSLPLPLGGSKATKRTRDLLSPLPIFDDNSNTQREAARRPALRSKDTGLSPAKRGRTALSAAESSPAILSSSRAPSASVAPSSSRRKTPLISDQENAPPPRVFGELEGSPATRTRSKTRGFDFSITLSPLTFRDSPQHRRRSEVERLMGDMPGLRGAVDPGLRDVSEVTEHGSPKSGKTGATKTPRALGEPVDADGALADVSEAYGVSGSAPIGFSSQGDE